MGLQPLYAGNGTGSLALDKWQFSQYGTEEWLDATVPGTVHQDLMAHDRLPDPFYGMNEQKIQWVEKEDWLYRTSFVLSQEQLDSDDVTLVFEGLDTYADVYLNGALVLKADNMFVGYRIPVKPVLRSGENRLVVRFRSPIRETMPQWASNGFDYPADNDHYPQKLSVFSRKAPYSYGWDWGIRMVTCGIWRLCDWSLRRGLRSKISLSVRNPCLRNWPRLKTNWKSEMYQEKTCRPK